MDPPSILCILVGILIIASRGPLIFAPSATLRFYDRLIATDARIRAIAIVIAPLTLALVALPLGEGSTARILHALGWLFAAATLWLLAAPGSYRRLARRMLGYFESSVDETILRTFGVVATAIGVAFLYVGIAIV